MLQVCAMNGYGCVKFLPERFSVTDREVVAGVKVYTDFYHIILKTQNSEVQH